MEEIGDRQTDFSHYSMMNFQGSFRKMQLDVGNEPYLSQQ